MPPLRERMDDVQMLAMHFLRKYAAREHSSMSAISDEAKEVLISYSWPGNVRELENAIERAVVLGKGEQLRAQDLPPQLHRRGDEERPLIPAHLTLEEIEKLAIAQALRLTGGNKSEAAERLGIHRTSIYDKMRRYGIEWTPQPEDVGQVTVTCETLRAWAAARRDATRRQARARGRRASRGDR